MVVSTRLSLPKLPPLVIACVMAVGCQPPARPQPAGPRSERELRDHWAGLWVERLERPWIARAYGDFLAAGRDRTNRGPPFGVLCDAIGVGLEDSPVSGVQLLDIIGLPDLWKRDEAGVVRLAYLYRPSDDDTGSVLLVTVGRDGWVKRVGYNDPRSPGVLDGFVRWD